MQCRFLTVSTIALFALAGCAGEPSVTEVKDAVAAPGGVEQSTAGCPVGGADIPADAVVVEAGDLDGDGQDDQVWLAVKGDKRLLGVRTASGSSLSTSFTADQVEKHQATALGNRLGDGTPIIVLATGYSAALYTVADCKIVPSLTAQGNQYLFDLGMNGEGTGVFCPKDDQGLYLASYNAKPDDLDSSDEVFRTRIEFSENGTRADNGKVTDLGHIKYDDPLSQDTMGVACGDAETALEPER
ncbi:hypothetical protein [Kineosporia babensis]|uniref:Uncharacterized protein n=1 Tax=Kineosporia babensis TaxID=499548 RepID=A0A9X1NCC2_9ACTN|nr:hypothetical protein [Kineosporia babensis]MCD5311161.1 hypothetical protein [Kineosporia babensis]